MWRLLELLAIAALLLISVTEFFYPLITGKPLFGSFRKRKVQKEQPETLDEKVNKAKASVNKIKDVQTEVDQHYKSAEQLKQEADELLNNNKKQ